MAIAKIIKDMKKLLYFFSDKLHELFNDYNKIPVDKLKEILDIIKESTDSNLSYNERRIKQLSDEIRILKILKEIKI